MSFLEVFSQIGQVVTLFTPVCILEGGFHWCYITKSGSWLVIIEEPFLVLYIEPFLGVSVGSSLG